MIYLHIYSHLVRDSLIHLTLKKIQSFHLWVILEVFLLSNA